MATLDATGQMTLLELAKRREPDGELAAVAEILSRSNPVLQDMPFMEANGKTYHKSVRRGSLPGGTWRKINAGVSSESSQTTEVTDAIGMLETYSEVDKALAEMSGDIARFRMIEAKAFIEGLSQTLAGAVFYSNSATDPEQITGLSPRTSTVDGQFILDGSGTGSDLTSIYVVQWGLDKVHGVYPSGHPQLGVQRNDLGEVTLEDAGGKKYQGYRDHYVVKMGLVVRDPRAIGRYANIESSGASNIFDEDKLIGLLNEMPDDHGNTVIYVNSTVKTQMEIKLKDKANVNYTVDNGLGGVPVLRFRGIPVKKCAAIVNTETAIS